MAKRTLGKSGKSGDWVQQEGLGLALTSGDLARMLHVDLKTIHNWVAAGHLRGRRTEGRHLRFVRPEIIRFMRQFGYAVPPALTVPPARVLVMVEGRSERSTLRRDWEVAEGPFEASLRLGAGVHEVAVLYLGAFAPNAVVPWVRAVRKLDLTSCVALVGVCESPQRRRAFLAAGADAAIPPGRGSGLTAIVGYLTGSVSAPPRTAEVPAAQERVLG
jgi:excisionase family DNA binding protein